MENAKHNAMPLETHTHTSTKTGTNVKNHIKNPNNPPILGTHLGDRTYENIGEKLEQSVATGQKKTLNVQTHTHTHP